jgi:hypothetical protein
VACAPCSGCGAGAEEDPEGGHPCGGKRLFLFEPQGGRREDLPHRWGLEEPSRGTGPALRDAERRGVPCGLREAALRFLRLQDGLRKVGGGPEDRGAAGDVEEVEGAARPDRPGAGKGRGSGPEGVGGAVIRSRNK